MVGAICMALIAYEVIRRREVRAAIRARRGALRSDDLAGFERERSWVQRARLRRRLLRMS